MATIVLDGGGEPVVFKEEVSVSPKQVTVFGDRPKGAEVLENTEQGGETELKRQLVSSWPHDL